MEAMIGEEYQYVATWAKCLAGATGRPQEDLECEALANIIERLIFSLYEPSPIGMRLRPRLAKAYGLNEDAVNWGDIEPTEVIKHKDTFIVTLEEAGDAPHLIAYLKSGLYCGAGGLYSRRDGKTGRGVASGRTRETRGEIPDV